MCKFKKKYNDLLFLRYKSMKIEIIISKIYKNVTFLYKNE